MAKDGQFELLFCHWNFVVRDIFTYIVIFRILGLSVFDEMETLHKFHESEEANSVVIQTYTDKLAEIADAIETGTCEERYPKTVAPYMVQAWKEYETKKAEKQMEWLVRMKKGDLKKEAFPYPEVKISSQFDQSERSIEEW